MPFNNPVVGGTELVRNAIRSENFQQGAHGWQVSRDGSAEFENAVSRGTISAQAFSADTIQLAGIDLGTEIDHIGKGAVAWGEFTWTSPFLSYTTETGTIEVAFQALPNRVYRIEGRAQWSGNHSTNNITELAFRFTTDNTIPRLTSAKMENQNWGLYNGQSLGESQPIYHILNFGNANPITVRILLTATLAAGIGPGTLYYARLDITDVGNAIVYGSNGAVLNNGGAGGGGGAKATYDVTWYSTGVQTYNSVGGLSSALGANVRGYQGDGTPVGNPGGNSIGLFFFDSADMRAQLAGATILNSFIYVHNLHSYYNSGITAVLGTHAFDSAPISEAGGDRSNRWQINLAEGAGGWTADLTTWAIELQNGTTHGICVGFAPNNNLIYYGYFDTAAVRVVFQK